MTLLDKWKSRKRKGAHKTPAKKKAIRLIEKKKGSLDHFFTNLETKSSIGLILGKRGSGKTALGLRVLENLQNRGKKLYALGIPRESLPKWITVVQNVEDVQNNSFLLVDEGGISFSSRSSMSSANQLLSNLLLISRHKDISVLFITQNSSNLEVNALRQADFLLLKQPGLLQMDFERKKIKDIYKDVESGFSKHIHDGAFYIYSTEFQGFAENTLPSFWSESISKHQK